MEEYTRKHLSESVYPFVYVPQKNPHIFVLKKKVGKREAKVLLK